MILIKYFLIFIFFSFILENNSLAQGLELNEEEKLWLNNHPVIKISYDKNFPPYEWKTNEGNYQGISIDYIQLIEKQLKLKFKKIEHKSWSQVLKEFKAGNIDMLSAIAKNDLRQEYMLFTPPYIRVQGVIVSSKEYKSLKELTGEKVGVVNDNYWDDLISHYDNDIKIIRVDNAKSGIELVSIGAIDAMVTDLGSVTYHIHEDSISNLKFVPVPLFQNQKLELSIGIRKDWSILQAIIQKALNNISKTEKEQIDHRWLKVQEISFWQDTGFQNKVLILALIIIAIISMILFWNRSLKLQVQRRSVELENAHKQLIHAEKMESIGRLSAGVAHEVKNPLAILQMSVDYLKGEDNDETIITILDDMDDAIARADKVIKGLLDFSREKDLQVSQGDINEVIIKSLRLIEHELKQHNVTIKTSLADDLPGLAMDFNRLTQVFINLFMNSVQAMYANKLKNYDSEIEISSSMGIIAQADLLRMGLQSSKEKRLFTQQPTIIIKIIDTGHGLDANSEKNIFEPFFTTKPVGEGTGLGLSVSKTIINLHHGIITMHNRSDQTGVEVTIYFALKEE